MEPRPGRGVLFVNKKKSQENSPDWTGDLCLEDGRVIKLSGWMKTSKSGDRYMSLSIREERQYQYQDGDENKGSGGRAVRGYVADTGEVPF